ncbi:MAG: NAD(P)H-dependent oxidoreductase [Bacteroidales bacterium]|nr:NAD(P)H-dependent oxidoreductase [Bacteroidales bacterium]
MNILLFNGSFERNASSISHRIITYFKSILEQKNVRVTVFNMADSDIPILDVESKNVPHAAVEMNKIFREADVHIWFTPLYHGSMTGAMKNALDWMELSAKESEPYLTNKVVGLVCWADGGQAMQGINAMESVAKALRAWTLPYCIPAVRRLVTDNDSNKITEEYSRKFDLMVKLLVDEPLPKYKF